MLKFSIIYWQRLNILPTKVLVCYYCKIKALPYFSYPESGCFIYAYNKGPVAILCLSKAAGMFLVGSLHH